jgi:hypothetical protein
LLLNLLTEPEADGAGPAVREKSAMKRGVAANPQHQQFATGPAHTLHRRA